MTAQERFEALQARWRAAHDKQHDLRFKLRYAYGDTYYIHAPKAKRDRADRASKAADFVQDAIFAWLDANSPRSWRTGVPCYWVCESLTYADAITTGQLSVTPPVAYGGLPSDSIRFAAALPTKEPAFAW